MMDASSNRNSTKRSLLFVQLQQQVHGIITLFKHFLVVRITVLATHGLLTVRTKPCSSYWYEQLIQS
jgi:hypothetical protein